MGDPTEGDKLGKPVTREKEETRKEKRKEKGTENEFTKKQNGLTIGCWNIRRGLVRRETELKELLNKEEIDVLFLVETDTQMIGEEKDYVVQGYRTILPKLAETDNKIRIMSLVKEGKMDKMKIRHDLMSENFPSIWLEIERINRTNLTIGGFYREWTRHGDSSKESQLENIKILTHQITTATNLNKPTIILGDANLCMKKWEEIDYPHKEIAHELTGALAMSGMQVMDVGMTYLADRLTQDGDIIESALDHIYVSTELANEIGARKSEESSTDHVPIIAELKNERKQKQKQKTIIKRSMKNFTEQRWKECLVRKNWEKLAETEDIEQMTEDLTKLITEALDECAPMTKFKLNTNYKHGLTKETKELIKERDNLRKEIKRSPNEKKTIHERYKKLRNRVTNEIRMDRIRQNGERIARARREDEVWKVLNEVTKPKEDKQWTLLEGGKEVENEEKIAEIFNDYFIRKIEDLKDNIDSTQIKDPTEKLKEKVKNKNLHFSMKTVRVKKVREVMAEMRKKKSSGLDGIGQDVLLMGGDILAIPLTRVINNSIINGKFPTAWKKAVVTPLLKKGDPKEKSNYRPVSCLAAASKVLEKIVCQQITRHMESNNLLPDSQHGFREKRSTMTALSEIQRDWMENTEDKKTTGVLFWDLSAAFDTLNSDLLIEKLKLYGCDTKTCEWFNSFLTGREQMVRIGKYFSRPCQLKSGVPQGSILSPIIFTIYCADLEEWVKHSKLLNYADDTSTSLGGKDLKTVIENLEEDAKTILNFMASNGLVANPSKTEFMLLNNKENVGQNKIKVGETEVKEVNSAKLLGMMLDNDQKWTSHFWGKKGLLKALNQRLFALRRVANHIPKDKLRHVASSLWMSKVRYGLQLTHKVRLTEEDKKNKDLKATQIAQNKMLRLLDGCRIRDRRSVKDMLEKFDMLSINQTIAQIKIMEAWKANKDENYPIHMRGKERTEGEEPARNTRASRRGEEMPEGGKTKQAEESFVRDTGKLWNRTPIEIKEATTKGKAKQLIRTFCKSLPI